MLGASGRAEPLQIGVASCCVLHCQQSVGLASFLQPADSSRLNVHSHCMLCVAQGVTGLSILFCLLCSLPAMFCFAWAHAVLIS